MDLLGYADRYSARPGEQIRFMVSCRRPHYDADLVRLQHGDLNPAGPGAKILPVESDIAGRYPGQEQRLTPGSSVEIPADPRIDATAGLTLQCWIWATTPVKRPGVRQDVHFVLEQPWHYPDSVRPEPQGLIEQPGAFALSITAEGELSFQVGAATLRGGRPLRAATWYFVAATYDPAARRLRLIQTPVTPYPYDDSAGSAEGPAGAPPAPGEAPLRIGAGYNGKIDSPRLFARALPDAALAALAGGADPLGIEGLTAAWDFSRDIESARVSDIGPHGLHGRALQMPGRGVTGWNWSGRETCFRLAPAEYGAIYFHDDDLEDAGWEPSLTLTVPALPSGVYALRLRAGEAFDHIPFFIRPPATGATAPILFLAPTLSYLAYANDHMPTQPVKLARLGITLEQLLADGTPYERSVLQYIIDNRLFSLYDRHSDGSGTFYTSRLRPVLNMRPLYNKPGLRFTGTHQFNEDLYLIDWMAEKGHRFDVATDEDLHLEGESLLRNYKVLMTGSHPEYWSFEMLEALERYLAGGGRIMYMGGNGFYWVTSFDRERPHVAEVRRGESGIRLWQSEPGEYHHSTTGELGGLWRYRGKAPQRIVGVGVGMSAVGGDRASPYRREAGSFDPRAAFIFEGIGPDEIIGDFGLHLGGAAGWELDRYDTTLGTPPHALLLASSFGHNDTYQYTVEEVWKVAPNLGGTTHPFIRADLTYFELPNDGAVFSTGSISWAGSLSHNGYDNNVSRITDNVLRAFARDRLPRPAESSS